MLKIIKPEDAIEVKTVNLTFYSQPGLGKTSLAQTSESPITFDFDWGIARAAIRKDSVRVLFPGMETPATNDDSTQYTKFQDVMNVTAAEVSKFKTIVIDTAGRYLDMLSADIIQKNPKMGNAGALTLQGFGQLKSRFVAWMKLLNSLGKDVVLIAHMEEQKSGDDMLERLEIQGGSKGEIYKISDGMARIVINNRGERMIDFSPRPNSYGKNPCQFDLIPFPDPRVDGTTLAKIISTLKQRLNKLSQEQQDQQQIIEEWAEAFKGMSSPEELNQILPQIKPPIPAAVRSHLVKRANELKFRWDKNTNLFVRPEQAEIHAIS